MRSRFCSKWAGEFIGAIGMGLLTKGTDHFHRGIPGFLAGRVSDNAAALDDSQITGFKGTARIRTKKNELHGVCRIAGNDLRTCHICRHSSPMIDLLPSS